MTRRKHPNEYIAHTSLDRRSKLTADEVMEMRRLYRQDKSWTINRLARTFMLGPAQVSKIVNGLAWQHLPDMQDALAGVEEIERELSPAPPIEEISRAEQQLLEQQAEQAKEESPLDRRLRELTDERADKYGAK